MIHFSCEGCGKDYKIDDTCAGKKFSCKLCNYVMCVPGGRGANERVMQFKGRKGSEHEVSIWIKNWVTSQIESFAAQTGFEDFVISLITDLGYEVERIPDDRRNGIDYLATGSDKKIALQVKFKAFNEKVDRSEIDLLISKMRSYDAASAISITNRVFADDVAGAYSELPIAFWDQKEIVKLYTKLTLYSTAVPPQDGGKKFWSDFGERLLAEGHYPEALDCFSFVLTLDATSAKAHLSQAICYEKTGDIAKALRSAYSAVRNNANFAKYISLTVDYDYFKRRLLKKRLDTDKSDSTTPAAGSRITNDKGLGRYMQLYVKSVERNYSVRDWDNNKLSFVKVDLEIENLSDQTIEFSLMDTQFFLMDIHGKQYPHINPIDINSFQRKHDVLHRNNFKILGNSQISGQVLFGDVDDDVKLKKLVLTTELFVGTNNFIFCHDEAAVDIAHLNRANVKNLSG